MAETTHTYKKREDLLQALIERLNTVMRMMRPHHEGHVPPLSPPHMHLFFAIAMSKEGKSVKELAELSGVTPGAISQFVNHLVEHEMVQRETDPNDRRIVRLKTTDKARRQHDRMKREFFAQAKQVFSVLNDDEIIQLLTILKKIEVSLEPREP